MADKSIQSGRWVWLVLILLVPALLPGQPPPTESPAEPATADTNRIFNGGGNYLWPTNASRYASSSFGETRSAHFHAALDIKTWGRKGYEVYATRDGTLARVGIWARGYGNVVYLRHEDGTYSIYAHLEDFAPRIRRLVDSLRLPEFQFELDYLAETDSLQFKRGEVIGYSGATGIGPPHLHFELRTRNNHPFNPLLTNLSIPDRRAPRFDGLAVEPLSADALVEGKKQIHLRTPRFTNGSYDFGSVEVQGTVGLAVDVFDLADRVSNAYAAYEVKLSRRSDVLFHSRVDSFSYSRARQLFLDRVYPLLKQNGQGFQRLYITDGNSLSFYRRQGPETGKLRLPPGQHTLTITAADYYGNQRNATLTLDVQAESVDTLTQTTSDFRPPPDSVHSPLPPRILDRWTWHKNWIAYPSPDSSSPVYTIYASRENRDPFRSPYILAAGQVHVIPTVEPRILVEQSSGRAVRLHRIVPGEEKQIHAGSGASVAFGKKALFDTLSVALLTDPSPDSTLPTLHVYPPNQPIRTSYELSYPLPDSSLAIPPEKWAFYRISTRDGEPEYLPTGIHENETFNTHPEQFGTFALIPDTTRPVISDPRIYREDDGQWHLSVKVDDNLSGMAYGKARMYVNGQRGIPRYDPQHKRLIYYHPQFSPSPQNELRVVLPDRAGNRQTATFTLSP